MSNLVIVAIPEEQDRVWKISSEKVPHLTLLFLGDEANADTQQIVQFVDHAVTMSEHGQIYLDVDRRGTLGPDDADVLFFSKRSWNLKWIKQFRSQLLQNQAIRTAYDSTQQYEEWTPHVTLGYPAPGTPAKPLGPDDHPIYSVCFDRIAVWTTDYDGPEFQLEWPERDLEGPLAVAYSDTQKAALAHYGVKGMKWGQRKAGEKDGANDTVARGAEFIEHHGIKGMKWGVRNRKGAPTAVTPTATSKVPHGSRRKTKIKTDGGENHPAHEDAIKVAVSKAKLKKSGPAALSNQELRDVANRVQLENQVKVLTSHKGRQFVTRQFQNEGQNLAREGVRTGVKKGAKRVGVAAALA